MYEQLLESIDCPLCGSRDSSAWAMENGFSAVKCSSCGLVFVNPRPNTLDISAANKIGVHRTEGGALEVSYRRHPRRVERYRKLIAEIFADEISSSRVLRWLDVGAGYGEFIEAATLALPNGSTICGIDPMEPKVRAAQARGLDVSTRSLSDVTGPFDVISLINVFSHVPDFRQFCSELKGKLAPNGVLFIQTGNGGDLKRRADYPDELCLPDHLVFAGREHIERYLNLAGFELTTVKNRRVDGIIGSVQTMLNNVRRGVFALRFPYTSPFRTVFYKAILRTGADGDVRAP
jgi:2-polyprenyl-3-methyl-5-hydroxy-6-metoxy-1,4-benzoquinol methylase